MGRGADYEGKDKSKTTGVMSLEYECQLQIVKRRTCFHIWIILGLVG